MITRIKLNEMEYFYFDNRSEGSGFEVNVSDRIMELAKKAEEDFRKTQSMLEAIYMKAKESQIEWK